MKSFQQTQDYTCAACAVMDILDYYRFNVKEIDEKKISEDLGSTPEKGTPIQNIAVLFWQHKWDILLSTEPYDGDWDDVLFFVKDKKPVILLTNDWGGHYVVMWNYMKYLYSHSGGACYLLDPAACTEDNEYRIMSAEHVKANWESPISGVKHGFLIPTPRLT